MLPYGFAYLIAITPDLVILVSGLTICQLRLHWPVDNFLVRADVSSEIQKCIHVVSSLQKKTNLTSQVILVFETVVSK